MPKSEPTKRNLRRAMLSCFHLKTSAAGCHVSTIRKWKFRASMNPWIQGNAVHMVGPEGCNSLWIAKPGRNHHRQTLPNSVDEIESCSKGNTAGMRGKTQPNYSSTRQRSTPYCESGENEPCKAWLGNEWKWNWLRNAILSWHRAIRLLFVSCAATSQETLLKTVDGFERCLRLCLQANGEHFE